MADTEWPTPWELSAPESFVLSYRGGTYRQQPLVLALKELVARQVLALDEVPGRRRMQQAIGPGARFGENLEPPLGVVRDLCRSPLAVAEIAKSARKRRPPVGDYHRDHVASALIERGLLERGQGGFDWTDAGREADARLSEWLDVGRRMLADGRVDDVARAAAFTRGAGAAVLLLPEINPSLRRLIGEQASGVGGGGGGGGDGGDLADFPDLPDLGGLDLGGLDFGGIDFGGFGGGDGGGGGGDGGGGG